MLFYCAVVLSLVCAFGATPPVLVFLKDFGEEDGEDEDDEDDTALFYSAVALSLFLRLWRGDFRYTTMLFILRCSTFAFFAPLARRF